jgi:acetylornithine/succinyldiaminopimelate/putrescine aminotransferase
MSDPFFTQAYRPLLPDINFITFNNFEDLDKITQKTAAVIIEPIQAESGIHLPEENYLAAVRKRCSETNTLLIFDEIQTGCGRTGSMFAFEQYQVIPDILLLAKGLGGGMPIGAFIASKEIMQVLSKNPLLGHITTFGGHPVSCAAAFATLKTIQSETLYQTVQPKANLFRQLLQHPLIKEIRNKGLMMAVELENFEIVQKVIQICLEKGVIIDWFLFNNKSLRIAPPLTITEEIIQEACAIIVAAMDEVKV